MSAPNFERGSLWVAVGLVAAGAACTTTPPAMETEGASTDQTTGATTGQSTESTTTATTTTAPTTTTVGTVTATTVPGGCNVSSDCASPCAFCYYGNCYEYECPPECYSDDSTCPIGELCEDEECVALAKIPTCDRQPLQLSAIPLQDAPDGVLLVDVDGDGFVDLVAAQPATGMVEIALGDGAGDFAAGVLFPTGLAGDPQRLAAADFDLDGDPDLALVRRAPVGELSLLFGQDAVFAAPVTFTMGSGPRQIFAGLVDDDQSPDVLVVDDAATFTLRSGDGMGGLGEPVATKSNSPIATAGVGDLDGDGTLELAVPNANALSLRLYDHGGNGLTQGHAFSGIGITPFNAALIADLPGGPTMVATRRVNGVGAIALWPADTAPNAPPPLEVAIPGGAFAVTAADFDDDGRRDLLVLKDANSFDLYVVFFGARGPECVQSHSVDHWAAPGRISVADVDGDARPDIVVGNAAGTGVSLLRSGP